MSIIVQVVAQQPRIVHKSQTGQCTGYVKEIHLNCKGMNEVYRKRMHIRFTCTIAQDK